MSNVHVLPTGIVPSTDPNEPLVAALRQLLDMAETGQLQSYVGTGFTHDGLRVSTFCDFHEDIYQMLGSLSWIQHEYVARHT